MVKFLWESSIVNTRLIVTFKGKIRKVCIGHIVTAQDRLLFLVAMKTIQTLCKLTGCKLNGMLNKGKRNWDTHSLIFIIH